MRRWILFGLAGAFFLTGAARADMIETKNDGILSGKVVSDHGNELSFKDAKGRTRVFKKTDVLYLEKEDSSKKIKQWARQAWDWLKNLPKFARKSSDQLTKKFVGKMSKPLDRSSADAKSAALARTMDEASQATAAMAKKTMKVNAEISRQSKEGFGGFSTEEKKGRFSSLDN